MTVINIDCVAGMRQFFPDNHFDSIVTDPPYELSSDGKASAAGVFVELMFPKNTKVKTDAAAGDQLSVLIAEILSLSGVGFQPRPSAAMEVRSVALHNDPTRGQHNVENVLVPTGVVAHGDAGGDIEAEGAKHLGSFLLELADAPALLDALNRTRCGFISGGVGVGFGGSTACLPSLLRGSGAVVVADQDVAALDYALALLVGASRAAEDATVARIGLGRGSIDELSAIPALVLLSCLSLGGAKLVRALPAASRLPSELEARRICVVGGPAGRTLSFDLVVHPQSIASMGFMGKAWDGSKIAFNVEMWREALRVLKPGGHLLAFSGSRTYHRMVVAIEDAGFEIRDQIMWVYGSGFPKSLDVSKAIDKAAGADREVIGPSATHTTKSMAGGAFNDNGEREAVQVMLTAPATDAARQWQGWGTALKPAHEPIVLARKPLVGTVAANVLQHGTGALSIDGCRVPTDDNLNGGAYSAERKPSDSEWVAHGGTIHSSTGRDFVQPTGRWPANLIHDGSDEVLAAFPQAPGQLADASSSSSEARKTQNAYGAMRRGRGTEPSANSENAGAVGFKMKPGARRLDEGSAARFFYCAKASKSDRGEGNVHPTVKPTELMRYLCRLVTPPGGTVLDPFTGSGSTGVAAALEGFQFIGFELSAEYTAIATARINHARRMGA